MERLAHGREVTVRSATHGTVGRAEGVHRAVGVPEAQRVPARQNAGFAEHPKAHGAVELFHVGGAAAARRAARRTWCRREAAVAARRRRLSLTARGELRGLRPPPLAPRCRHTEPRRRGSARGARRAERKSMSTLLEPPRAVRSERALSIGPSRQPWRSSRWRRKETPRSPRSRRISTLSRLRRPRCASSPLGHHTRRFENERSPASSPRVYPRPRP